MSYNIRTPLPTYSTGTISGSSGSNTVTGVGTAWTYSDSSGNNYNAVMGGDQLVVNNQAYIIASVNSATSITLQTELTGTVNTGSSYVIVKYQANLTGGVSAALAALMAMGSDTSPEASLAVDNGAGRIKLRIATSGDPQIAVGPSGAADSALATAFDITEEGLVSTPNGYQYAVSPARRNRIINGQFDIWQRGTSFTLAASTIGYTADRWLIANGSGAAVVISKVSAPTGFRGQNAINFTATGAPAGWSIESLQRFESQMVADLDSQACVLSFDVNASTSVGTLVGTLYVIGNSAVDNGSWNTGLGGGQSFTIPSGSGKVMIPLSSSIMAGAKFGFEIIISFVQTGADGNLNITIGSVQFEAGTVAQPFEVYALGAELALCQRYYETGTSEYYGYAAISVPQGISVPFKTTKRVAPSMGFSNTFSYNAQGSDAPTNVTPQIDSFFYTRIPINGSGQTVFTDTWIANSEL